MKTQDSLKYQIHTEYFEYALKTKNFVSFSAAKKCVQATQFSIHFTNPIS